MQVAENHAHYYVQNDGNSSAFSHGAHSEVEEFPGFTGAKFWQRMDYTHYDGQAAAEVMTFGPQDPSSAIASWMETVYHRLPFMNPGIDEMGYGQAMNNTASTAVVDFGFSSIAPIVPEDSVVVYPIDGQTDLNTSWHCNEWPQPFPGVDCRNNPVGTVITIQAWGNQSFDSLELRTSNGALVNMHQLFVEDNRNLWYTAPRQPLNTGTTYNVTLRGTDHTGNADTITWSFTTAQ